jgi:hypothetical protein
MLRWPQVLVIVAHTSVLYIFPKVQLQRTCMCTFDSYCRKYMRVLYFIFLLHMIWYDKSTFIKSTYLRSYENKLSISGATKVFYLRRYVYSTRTLYSCTTVQPTARKYFRKYFRTKVLRYNVYIRNEVCVYRLPLYLQLKSRWGVLKPSSRPPKLAKLCERISFVMDIIVTKFQIDPRSDGAYESTFLQSACVFSLNFVLFFWNLNYPTMTLSELRAGRHSGALGNNNMPSLGMSWDISHFSGTCKRERSTRMLCKRDCPRMLAF